MSCFWHQEIGEDSELSGKFIPPRWNINKQPTIFCRQILPETIATMQTTEKQDAQHFRCLEANGETAAHSSYSYLAGDWWNSFNPHSVLRQAHSLFQNQFSTWVPCMLPFVALKSFGSCLFLLPQLPLTSIPPFIFPSVTCFRRQFLHQMSPFQLDFLLVTGRSRVRFPMVSLEFFIDIILPVALWPWGWLSL